MKKIDRRTLYTENVIKETILELLQTKPINKITVSSVCKIADINRGTFYLHYKDCLDVLEQLQEEYCNKVINSLEENKSLDPLDIILNLHQLNKSNEDDYLIFMRSDLPMRSFKKLTDYGKKIIIDRICSASSLSRDEADWIAHYMLSASIGMTQKYSFDAENKLERETLIQQFVEGGLATLAKGHPK